MQFTIYHIHDPMCSWCYAFKPTLDKIRKSFDSNIEFIHIVGGLARQTNTVMPKEQQETIESIWYQIHEEVGTKFNHDFWKKCKPRRSTYLACQATIVARLENKEDEMIEAIQNAYYQRAMNPSDEKTLVQLASEIGLNEIKFKEDLNSQKIAKLMEEDLNKRRKMQVRVFPTLLLQYKKELYPINIKYNDAETMIKQIKNLTNNYYF